METRERLIQEIANDCEKFGYTEHDQINKQVTNTLEIHFTLTGEEIDDGELAWDVISELEKRNEEKTERPKLVEVPAWKKIKRVDGSYNINSLSRLTEAELKECYDFGYIEPLHYHKELMVRNNTDEEKTEQKTKINKEDYAVYTKDENGIDDQLVGYFVTDEQLDEYTQFHCYKGDRKYYENESAIVDGYYFLEVGGVIFQVDCRNECYTEIENLPEDVMELFEDCFSEFYYPEWKHDEYTRKEFYKSIGAVDLEYIDNPNARCGEYKIIFSKEESTEEETEPMTEEKEWNVCQCDEDGNHITGNDEVLTGTKEEVEFDYRNYHEYDGSLDIYPVVEEEKFSDSHETSKEIVKAIFEYYTTGDFREKVWQSPTPVEKSKIMKRAWELTDKYQTELYWGCETEIRPEYKKILTAMTEWNLDDYTREQVKKIADEIFDHMVTDSLSVTDALEWGNQAIVDGAIG